MSFPNPFPNPFVKAIIYRRKKWIVLPLLEKVFLFQKDAFYNTAHACGI